MLIFADAGRLCLIVFTAVVLAGCAGPANHIKVYNQGVEQYNGGNYSQAIGLFKWSIERQREYPPALLGLAHCYLNLARESADRRDVGAVSEDIETALYWVNQAEATDPGNREVYRCKLAILRMRGRLETSTAAARWPGRDVGPTVSTMVMTAKTQANLGDIVAAVSTLEEGLELYPNTFELLYTLGEIYESADNADLAVKYYVRAARVDPNYPGLKRKIDELSTPIRTP